MNSRIHRGTLLLQEYEFEIRHIKGKENIVADTLTRNTEAENREVRKLQIGANILKATDGIYSLQVIQQDQNHMKEEEFMHSETTEHNIKFKRTRKKELYIINQGLAERILKNIYEE